MRGQLSLLGLDDDAKGGATFDPTRAYRYQLWRCWGDLTKRILWIMLNPSKADETIEDATVRRIVSFSMAWGFGRLDACSKYAWRATDPRELAVVADPVGPNNDAFIRGAVRQALTTVVAWGNSYDAGDRASAVLGIIRECGRVPMCLGVNRDGSPKHPLYLAGDTKLVPYFGRSTPWVNT